MSVPDLTTPLQTLGLQYKSAVSLEKAELHHVLDIAAQHIDGKDRLLAATSSNFTIRLFSRCRLAQTSSLTGHTDVISGVQFLHQDPELLMTSSHDKTLRIWDPRVSLTKEVQQFKGENNTHCSLLCCDVSLSDKILCAGTEKTNDDAYLLFWDRRKSTLLGCYEESHDDDITQVHFHPDIEKSMLSGSMDGLINVFDIMEMKEEDALVSTYNTEATVERAGWFGKAGTSIYAISHMVTWHMWDTERDESVQQVLNWDKKLEDMCKVDYLVDCVPSITTDSQILVIAGTYSGELHLLDLSDQEDTKVVRSLVGGHSGIVRCLHWDEKTETLVTGGEDSLLCLWAPNATGVGEVMHKQGKIKGKKVTAAKRSKPYK